MKQLIIGIQGLIYNNIVITTTCDEKVLLNQIAQVNLSLPIDYYFYEDGIRHTQLTHDGTQTSPNLFSNRPTYHELS